MPVLVKEVGWGISAEVARRLQLVGVAAIDVAGAGGTSWSQVEKFRIQDEMRRKVAGDFIDWGLSTADCLVAIRQTLPNLPLIASGGLVSGMDVAKAIALGASLAGMAGVSKNCADQRRLMSLVEEITSIASCMYSVAQRIAMRKKSALLKR